MKSYIGACNIWHKRHWYTFLVAENWEYLRQNLDFGEIVKTSILGGIRCLDKM